MTAAGTHALLAAVKVLFSGRQLAVARHQLRLVVGYIKTLAKVWRQGGRNLEEIQSIAKEVLSRKNEFPQQTRSERGNASGQELLVAGNEQGVEGLDSWSNSAMTLGITPDSLSTFWNMSNDLQPDIPIWFSSY